MEVCCILLSLLVVVAVFCISDIIRFARSYHKQGYIWKESIQKSIESFFDTHNDDKFI